MAEFEGLHFLAAFEGDAPDSDDDNASWCSGLTAEPADDPFGNNAPTNAPFKWGSEESNILNPFPFTGESGMKFNIENPEPIDIFDCICKPEFLTKIILGTNAYARKQQKFDEEHYGHWKTLTMNETRQFLGLLFHTGTIRMNNLSDYWSINRLFDFRIFRSTMTLNRFLRILTALRFGNERIHQEDGGKSLMAFNLMLGDLIYAMQSVCYPARELAIDDCQVVTKQGIFPMANFDLSFTKPLMLIHSVSEPNGLVHNVLITETSNVNYDEIVNSLVFDKIKRGHSVFLGKQYCSVETVRSLAFVQTYCTGILDSGDSCVPEELRNVALEKGGQPAMLFAEPGICLLKWRCREYIYAVSSEFRGCQENMISYPTDEGRTLKAPLMIRKCRKIKTRADRKELLCAYKPLEDVHLGSYRAVGLHFLQIMLTNSYILYSQYYKKMSFHEYRLSVIASLLAKDSTQDLYQSPSAAVTATSTTPSCMHFPKRFPKRSNQRPLRKRCRVCLNLGKRTDTYYHCAECPNQPALCLNRCFAEYHQNLKDVDVSTAEMAHSEGSVSQEDESQSERDDEDSQSSGGNAKMRRTEEKPRNRRRNGKSDDGDNPGER